MEGSGLLVRLGALAQVSTPSERNVISCVRGDPRAATAMSVRELAQASYTSASTVIRLCHKLGCSGYRDFQRKLLYELALTEERGEVDLEGVQRSDTPDQVVRKVVASCTKSIELTEQIVSTETLADCARRISEARVVELFGIGSSLLVAHDFEMKLMRIGVECHAYDDWHTQLLSAKNMSEETLAIAISYSGLTEETVECARVAREHGSAVIAITRLAADSPLARLADEVIYTAADEPLVRSGAMSSRMSQLMVVDMLYATCIMRDFGGSQDVIRRNYIEKRSSVRRAPRPRGETDD